MRQRLDSIKRWIARQWTVFKPWLQQRWREFTVWIVRLWHVTTDRDNRWLSVPCAMATLLVLLVFVKSCQGIVYSHSNECKIYKLGYTIDEARAIVATLAKEQADSFIARGEYDTIACPIIAQRYFIADNFDRYLAFHKADTTVTSLADIVAIVNVGKFPNDDKAIPCDTSKGQLMLVNGRHYLDEHYKPDKLVTFKKTCSYENNKALSPVVDAFMAMQKDCKKQTGAQLMVNSAYRSYKEQTATYKRNDKRYVAHAGHSEHQTGLAVDATSLQHPEKWSFGKSKEGKWMRDNCHKYGFILRYPEKQSRIMGFSYEPWHLRFVGIDAATRIHDEGITFDEYYAYYIESEKE